MHSVRLRHESIPSYPEWPRLRRHGAPGVQDLLRRKEGGREEREGEGARVREERKVGGRREEQRKRKYVLFLVSGAPMGF